MVVMTDTEAGNFGLGAMVLLQRADFQALIDVLAGRGYSILGPTVRNGTVVYEEVGAIEDLPIGLRDEQGGGQYRLEPSGDAALFGYTNGVQSWRRHLFPPRRRIWRAERTDNGFTIQAEITDPPKVAFLGVRPCEIRAIEIQDKVFIQLRLRGSGLCSAAGKRVHYCCQLRERWRYVLLRVDGDGAEG